MNNEMRLREIEHRRRLEQQERERKEKRLEYERRLEKQERERKERRLENERRLRREKEEKLEKERKRKELERERKERKEKELAEEECKRKEEEKKRAEEERKRKEEERRRKEAIEMENMRHENELRCSLLGEKILTIKTSIDNGQLTKKYLITNKAQLQKVLNALPFGILFIIMAATFFYAYYWNEIGTFKKADGLRAQTKQTNSATTSKITNELEVKSEAKLYTGFITAKSGVRLRKTPSLKGDTLIKIAFNKKVDVLSEDGPVDTIESKKNNWFKIKYEKHIGWVFGAYIKKEEIKPQNEITKVTTEKADSTASDTQTIKPQTNNNDTIITNDASINQNDEAIRLAKDILDKDMIKCSAGSFLMGCKESERYSSNSETQHKVRITKDFYICKYMVTQKQYKIITGREQYPFKGDDIPVTSVTWNESVEFCKKLNELTEKIRPTGYKFSLPTEAQWEYACRAGTKTALNSNKELIPEIVYEVACVLGNSKNVLQPVGKKQPNAWGIYDMHGNAGEWCLDWNGSYGKTKEERDPKGPTTGYTKIYRGGSYRRDFFECSSFCRRGSNSAASDIGFRLFLVSD